MKLHNKRDSPDCDLTKIILTSLLISSALGLGMMYIPFGEAPKEVRSEIAEPIAPTETVYASKTIHHTDVKSSTTVETHIIEPITYYDTLSDEEINMLEVTVQHEVGGLSDTYKRLIAELIYNRLQSGYYPSNVKEMLFQEKQFTGIEEWYSPDYPVDDETKKIIKDVFSQNTTSHNATAYYNPALSDPKAAEWFETSEYMDYLFSHSEESWGIEYTTRFFATEIPKEGSE